MRRGLLAALAPLAACFHPSYDHPACAADRSCPAGLVCGVDDVCAEAAVARDGGAGDAASDAGYCFGGGLLHLCFDAMPTGNLTVPTVAFDTDTDARCTVVAQAGGPELCVYTANAFTFDGAVTLTGSRPLVVIAATAITISAGGSIDATSHDAVLGAGGNPSACSAGTPGTGGTGLNTGGGGGAGGSFGTQGAAGGKGAGGTLAGAPGAIAAAPGVLRGGCAGSAGGNGQNATMPGPAGGNGGGAIYLSAGSSLSIAGDVFASGAGGSTRAGVTGAYEGGGGGGAGGMIGLDAPSITIDGRIAANGGGGGGGGGSDGGDAGATGSTTSWSTPAAGGVGRSVFFGAAGAGGAGAAGSAAAVAGKLSSGSGGAGGGGGGGGLGLVWIYGTVSGGTMISPTPALHDRH